MSGIKQIIDLLKKAAPRVEKLAETVSDVRSDVLAKGKIYQSTGMNTSQLRDFFKKSRLDGDQAIVKGKELANYVERGIEQRRVQGLEPRVQHIEHTSDRTFNKIHRVLSHPRVIDTRSEAHSIAKTLPKKSSLRNIVADRLNTERRQGREFDQLVRRFGELERREGSLADSYSATEQFRRASLAPEITNIQQRIGDIIRANVNNTSTPSYIRILTDLNDSINMRRQFNSNETQDIRAYLDTVEAEISRGRQGLSSHPDLVQVPFAVRRVDFSEIVPQQPNRNFGQNMPTPRLDMDQISERAGQALRRSEDLVSEAERVLNRQHPIQRSRSPFEYGHAETREDATEEGFDAYIRRKYGRPATRIRDDE